jgi:hypothetical protein
VEIVVLVEEAVVGTELDASLRRADGSALGVASHIAPTPAAYENPTSSRVFFSCL